LGLFYEFVVYGSWLIDLCYKRTYVHFVVLQIGFGIFRPKIGVHFHNSLFYKSIESACGGQDWVCFAYLIRRLSLVSRRSKTTEYRKQPSGHGVPAEPGQADDGRGKMED